MISALLFTWLQGADFYRDLHKKAVDALPPGDGKSWLDMGCGPGLVSRLAAAKNYRVLGIDRDPSMIITAHLLALGKTSNAKFKRGDLKTLTNLKADVVSAASFLAVLPDKQSALQTLWNSVKPGGHLLLVEPTNKMTVENANTLINSGLPGKRRIALRMWARAREGRAVNSTLFDAIHAEHQTIDLLDGLVWAWIFQKSKASDF